MKNKEYCIIKKIKLDNGREVNVILVDTHSEILEFSDKEKCEDMVKLLNVNSDSGWVYELKEI